MIWVVLLVALAIIFGGIGLIVEALQFLFGVGIFLVLVAIGVGFWLRGKMTSGGGRSRR
jgi:hypothetical protein